MSSTTLQVDRVAHEVFNVAAIAAGMNDADAALEVCRKLGEIEKHYRLAPRTEERSTSAGSRDTGPTRGALRRMDAKFPGRCAKCATAISVGMPIAYDAEKRRAFHDRCTP